MKYLLTIFFLCFGSTLKAQVEKDHLIGKYQDYFGDRIEIKADSTFRYSWQFDLAASWSKGIWKIKNDTVYFKTIPVYDTLRYKNNQGKFVDSLVLSDLEKPKLIFTPNIDEMLSSGGQNREQCPLKLFLKDERLYGITEYGKLVTKKVRGFWDPSKKWDPWYFKEIEK